MEGSIVVFLPSNMQENELVFMHRGSCRRMIPLAAALGARGCICMHNRWGQIADASLLANLCYHHYRVALDLVASDVFMFVELSECTTA